MTFPELRALPEGDVVPNVQVQAKKDLLVGHGKTQTLHVPNGTIGLIYFKTEAGWLTSWSNGEKRQVLDLPGQPQDVENEVDLVT